MKYGVYLSGPIAGCTDAECVYWRERAAQLLDPIRVLDPVKRRDSRGREHEPGMVNRIVEEDIADLYESFLVLVMFDKPSVGTSMEVRIAYHERKIPVYVINASGKVLPIWLQYHMTKSFPSLAQACQAARSFV